MPGQRLPGQEEGRQQRREGENQQAYPFIPGHLVRGIADQGLVVPHVDIGPPAHPGQVGPERRDGRGASFEPDQRVDVRLPAGTEDAGAVAREQAVEVFNAVVRRKEVPADIQTVPLPDGVGVDGGVRVDKLLARVGLCESVTDAVRKIKAGAVEINGEKVKDLLLKSPPAELIVQVGKGRRKVV